MNIVYKTGIPPLDQYSELFESTGWNKYYHLSKEELNTALINSSYMISAYNGDSLLGFGRIVSDGINHAMIYDMIVQPEFQGQGIGAEILDKLVKYCLDNNIREIQLFCAKGKRQFYEKYGFEVREEDAPGMEFKNFKYNKN